MQHTNLLEKNIFKFERRYSIKWLNHNECFIIENLDWTSQHVT